MTVTAALLGPLCQSAAATGGKSETGVGFSAAGGRGAVGARGAAVAGGRATVGARGRVVGDAMTGAPHPASQMTIVPHVRARFIAAHCITRLANSGPNHSSSK